MPATVPFVLVQSRSLRRIAWAIGGGLGGGGGGGRNGKSSREHRRPRGMCAGCLRPGSSVPTPLIAMTGTLSAPRAGVGGVRGCIARPWCRRGPSRSRSSSSAPCFGHASAKATASMVGVRPLAGEEFARRPDRRRRSGRRNWSELHAPLPGRPDCSPPRFSSYLVGRGQSLRMSSILHAAAEVSGEAGRPSSLPGRERGGCDAVMSGR